MIFFYVESSTPLLWRTLQQYCRNDDNENELIWNLSKEGLRSATREKNLTIPSNVNMLEKDGQILHVEVGCRKVKMLGP